MSSPFLTSPLSDRRSISRPPSRGSINGRASPIVNLQDDPVGLRTQISTLKHKIRHDQAQLHTLENTVLRGPRPIPPGMLDSPPMSPNDFDLDPPPYPGRSHSHSSSPSSSSFSSHAIKMQRRSSHEILSSMAGPDSNLPLPRPKGRSESFGEENGFSIREGIPTPSPSKRNASPTRTLSRIPVSSVGNARALAEDDHSSLSSSSTLQPNSPNRRASFAPGNTTKVLADLQAGVLNAKAALENTKSQLRQSQRQVSTLTRQVEDMKEVRERLRLENEGLNNVVARKERLLQETLVRARKAEAEAADLKSQLKSETTTSKKSLREMETALVEARAKSERHEREYNTLRDSFKGLTESFKSDHAGLREELRKREEKMRKEAEAMHKKYMQLVDQVKKDRQANGQGVEEIKRLREESDRLRKEAEERMSAEVMRLREEVDRSNRESEGAIQTAKNLAEELARLRRLMRASGSVPTEPMPDPSAPSS